SEMDFNEQAMRGADHAVKRLRQRVAEWGPPGRALSFEAEEFDRRFRYAAPDDLDMPHALVMLNEAVSSSLPDGEKVRLLSSWDAVLGLDLGHHAPPGLVPAQ